MMNVARKEMRKGNKRGIGAAVLVAGAAALVAATFLGPKPAPDKIQDTVSCPGVKDNHKCEQGEAYPILFDKDGKALKDDKGNHVPNPCHSIIDCHEGDGQCQATEVKDMLGNVVEVPKQDAYGKPVTLPLENANSPDCIRTQCGPVQEKGVIEGKLSKLEGKQAIRKLTIEEYETLHAQVDPGYPNTYETLTPMEQVCDKKKPPCGPLVEGPCYCENHVECKSDDCGNEQVDYDKGEKCDPSAPQSKWKCEPKQICNKLCQCVTPGPAPALPQDAGAPAPVPTAVTTSEPVQDAGASSGPLGKCSDVNPTGEGKVRDSFVPAAQSAGNDMATRMGLMGQPNVAVVATISFSIRGGRVAVHSTSANCSRKGCKDLKEDPNVSLYLGGGSLPEGFKAEMTRINGSEVGGPNCTATVSWSVYPPK